MKHLLLFATGLILTLSPLLLFSQAPEGINYQAVVRNSSGLPLINKTVSVRFSIHQASPTGIVVFQETQTDSTNQFGLINLALGSINNATFSTINWGAGVYYLQVEVNPGSGFENLGTTQLLSVPYALFAKSAATGPQGLNSLIDTANAAGFCPNGGYQVLMGLDTNSNTVLETGEISSSFYVCNGATGGTNLNDTSSTNELQTLSISNDTIFLTNGGFIKLPGAAKDNDWIISGNNMNSTVIGNIGVGTTTPSKKLSVETAATAGDGIQLNNTSTGNPGIEFQTQGTPRYVMGVHQADNNKFKIGTTDVSVDTRFTINNQGQVGVGTTNPLHQLTVSSPDTIIANFVGANTDASAIAVTSLNPSATAGAIFLAGGDTGIIGMDPLQKTFSLSNNTANGHIALHADSSTALYGETIGNIANSLIYNQAISKYNEMDTIFNYSPGGQIIQVNQGSFLTDSLYVLGKNASNANWVLANDGLGQAIWTNPALIGGASLWQFNTPDIYFNTGKVGIGTIAPQQLLTLSNPTSTTLRLERTNASAYDWELNIDNLGFHLKGGADGSGAGLTDFVNVDGFGRIGLGITTPSQKLHIYNGTLRIDDGANPYNLPTADGTTSGQVLTTDAAGNVTWQTPATAPSLWTDGGTNIYPTTLSDNVSIGINLTSNAKFQVDNINEKNTLLINTSLSSGSSVYGLNSIVNSTSPEQYGVTSLNTTSAAGALKYGFYTSLGGAANTNYGIYTEITGATKNWAAYFAAGNVYVADTLVIPTGAGQGKILTSDPTGNASWKPNQISFEVRASNIQSVDATPVLLQLDAIQLDDGGNFDPSAGNYMFVAPVAGVYTFQTNVLFDYSSAGSNLETVVEVLLNGSPVYTSIVPITNMEKVTNNNSSTIRLSPNDKLQVRIFVNGGGPPIMTGGSDRVWFSGHLVYAY